MINFLKKKGDQDARLDMHSAVVGQVKVRFNVISEKSGYAI